MTVAWTPDRRAESLLPRRDELIRRLPRVLAAARSLTDDERELVVDDALTHVVMEYRTPIHTEAEAERVFWAAAKLRVARALEGRNATVRGRYERASEDAALHVASRDDDPAETVERSNEIDVAVEFASTLDQIEGQVLRVKWLTSEATPLGYRKVAGTLGIPSAEARAVERSIASKLERFAALAAAGRLCAERSTEITALASGAANRDEVKRARAHLKHCSACKMAYVTQLRDMRSADFQRTVASLTPIAPIVEQAHEHAARVRDVVADWIARLLGHDSGTVTQLVASGTGRGAGAAMLVKVAALLASGAAAVGVATGVLDDPPSKKAPPRRAATTPTATPAAKRPVTSKASPAPTPRKPRHTKKTQGGTGKTDHEQAPASKAAQGSQSGGASEFTPAAANSQPAGAAPVSAAPGSSEFP